MSASKAVLDFSQSIVVDTGESAALPPLVKEAYQRGGASIPIVIFTDPGVTQIYDSFNYATMKSQKYGTIFKDVRDKIQKSIKEETFILGEGNEPKLVKVEGSKIEEWTSSKGSSIKAKLVGIEDDQYFLFETEKGAKIRATAAQLSQASVTKARKMAAGNWSK